MITIFSLFYSFFLQLVEVDFGYVYLKSDIFDINLCYQIFFTFFITT